MDWPLSPKTTIGLACRSAEIHNRQCAAQHFCIVLNADFPCPSSEWVENRKSHMLGEVQGFKVPAFCQIRQHPRCIGSQLQL